MSTLEEPPADRQPVQTYVLEHDWAIIEDAVRRELGRGGQVYYLHNRVESIDSTAARLQKMLGPEVRIVTGHGKMSEQELSSVMQAMVDGEADILVCTTIIETGIDIPNVNTLIIEDADRMGLAQLHQIRGRIGRSARRAYAYLTYRRGKVLQETAAKRLAAIREYVEFGSGFKIAMRDLEIRGAGNLLGPEQSGYLMSVGYDLYLKLLEEAVLEERGEERRIETECAADLTVNAHIPDRYVPSPEQRMDLYRRIAAIRTDEDASDLLDEMLDRYGEAPKIRAGPAGRGAAPGRRGRGRRLRHLPEGQRAALPAGDLPAGGPGGGLRPGQVPPAADAGRRRGARPVAEAQARRGRAGGRPDPGGGPEAGLGGRRTVRRAGGRLSAPCASHCHIATMPRIGCQRWDSPAPSGAGLFSTIPAERQRRTAMRRTTALCLALAASLTLTACGGSTREEGILARVSGLDPEAAALSVDGREVPARQALYWLAYTCDYIAAACDGGHPMGGHGGRRGPGDLRQGPGCPQRRPVRHGGELGGGLRLRPHRRGPLRHGPGVGRPGRPVRRRGRLPGGAGAHGPGPVRAEAISRDYYLYRQLYDLFRTEGSALYPAQEDLETFAREQGYLTVDHIWISTAAADPADEAAVAACRARAEEAFSKLNGSPHPPTTFAVLAETYSDETDRDQHPEGYTFALGDGTLPAACEEAASALEEGQWSGVVEAEDGFYLLLRKATDLDAVAPDYFDAMLQAAADSADISLTRAFSDLDVSRFYEALTEARETLSPAAGGNV